MSIRCNLLVNFLYLPLIYIFLFDFQEKKGFRLRIEHDRQVYCKTRIFRRLNFGNCEVDMKINFQRDIARPPAIFIIIYDVTYS